MALGQQVNEGFVRKRVQQVNPGDARQLAEYGALDMRISVNRINDLYILISVHQDLKRFTNLVQRLPEILAAVRSHQEGSPPLCGDLSLRGQTQGVEQLNGIFRKGPLEN